MNESSSQPPAPSGGDLILYQTEDGRTRLQVRLDGETVWLSLNQLADLFQRDKSVISKHIRNVFAEGELSPGATVAKFATVQREGGRSVEREIEFYNLDVIISVGYRVKSHRGTQFRIWATQRLREYIVKGFTMDDERLKNPPGKGQKDYFDEQLERIRDNLLLHALNRGAAHILVSNDEGVHRKASRIGIHAQVYRLDQIVAFVAGQREKPFKVPYGIRARYLHEFDVQKPFFDSLRAGYGASEFNRWYAKASAEHRKCWCIADDKAHDLKALCIYKQETSPAVTDDGVQLEGTVLKLCTLKVAESIRGRKVGERLLYTAFNYATENRVDHIYIHTNTERHEHLISLVQDYGFQKVGKYGEDDVYAKAMKPPTSEERFGALEYAIRHHPHFRDDATIQKFIVPIQPRYHEDLFPDISVFSTTLFGNEPSMFSPQSNTIKKAYLCHCKTNKVCESEAIQRLLMDNLPAGVVIVDPVTRCIERVNDYVAILFGTSSDQLVGQRCHSVLCPVSEGACPVCDLGGSVDNSERVMLRKDGSRLPILKTVKRIQINGQEKLLECFVDISERKQLEEKLLRSERMESVGRLAAGVSHDLNNILTPIILSAEMLRAVDEPGTRECLISSIEQCAQRGAAVVDQVLTFVRGTKGEPTTLQLNGIVSDMEKIMKETFPKNIAITSAIPSDLWPVKADSTQLHQVILNLCINARDAMPEGGKILITGENVEIDENFAAMSLNAKVGDYAMLKISDSGNGIPPANISKIFEPFFTTKETGKGTGLGLSTAIGIVRSHGGFVTVNSELGHGATFNVFLPRETGGVVEQRHFANMDFQPGNGETILLVEDEELISKVAAIVLEKNGYKVLAASSGAEALALYEKHANEIDLVITDIMLPEMDGLQLSRSLKKINPHARIIASTGQATEAQKSKLRALGVHVILHKPYDAKKLLATLHDTIHREE